LCLLCVDPDEMEDDVSDNKADPWRDLEIQIFDAIREELSGFLHEMKPGFDEFIREKSIAIAREKWAEMNASNDAERELAAYNLRHLRSQIDAETARLKIASSERALLALRKVLGTVIEILCRVGPSILKSITPH